MPQSSQAHDDEFGDFDVVDRSPGDWHASHVPGFLTCNPQLAQLEVAASGRTIRT